MNKSNDKRGFFIEEYKTLIKFVCICSLVYIILDISVIISFITTGFILKMRSGIIGIFIFLLLNLVLYPINFNVLVKNGKVNKSVIKFIAGYFPCILAFLFNVFVFMIYRR